MTSDDDQADPPAFGPSGYLPDRAARRARKIVLRAPLGVQWIVGALVVGVVVAVAGWFALRPSLPEPPFVEVPASALPTDVEAPPQVITLDGTDVAIVTILGRVRVFDWSAPVTSLPTYCRESGLLESDDGGVWRATGRGVGGTDSLVELPTVVVDGRVFVDPTSPLPVLAPDPDTAPEAACGAAAG